MSATDELRRLLDGRGVEWMPSVFDPRHETFYSVDNGVGFIVTEFPEIGRVSLACDMRVTPEQAVEATLGRGTCKLVPTRDKPCSKMPTLTCSECGWWTEEIGNARNYCPNCGRKVVDA